MLKTVFPYLLVILLVRQVSFGAGPQLEEVLNLIKEHLPGISEAEIDRAAAKGLLQQLSPKVILVTPAAPEGSSGPALAKTAAFEEAFLYFRLRAVEPGSAKSIQEEFAKKPALKPRGVLLDLRFAAGEDYAEASAIADLFIPEGKILLSTPDKTHRSTAALVSSGAPLVVLVNQQTAGAAEALAAVLKEHASALLVGSATAGQAVAAKEFTLKNGDRVLIASSPISVNEKELPLKPIPPDVAVEVPVELEQEYLKDPYFTAAGGSTPRSDSAASLFTRIPRRPNEAELVRRHREGFSPELPTQGTGDPGLADGASPRLQDPALVRGLDLLKGLSILQTRQSQ